jgi:hypothetical protein
MIKLAKCSRWCGTPESSRADGGAMVIKTRIATKIHAARRKDTVNLALLWQILSGTGFPNQFFDDSWVVGFWRGRPWYIGSCRIVSACPGLPGGSSKIHHSAGSRRRHRSRHADCCRPKKWGQGNQGGKHQAGGARGSILLNPFGGSITGRQAR